MRRRTVLKLFPVVVLSLFLWINATSYGLGGMSASSQKQFHFADYEAQFEVKKDASIEVTEILTYQFEGGEFHAAYRYINLYKLDNVEKVHVFGSDGIPYTRVDPTDELLPPGQYFVKYEFFRVVIQWFYEADARTAPVTKAFTLNYVMTKAVQREDDMDVLDVDAVPADTPQVDQVTVTAILPGQFSADQVTIATAIQEDLVQLTSMGDKTTLQFKYENLPSDQAYRVIVGFPQTVQDYISPKRLINDWAGGIGIFWILGTIALTIYIYMARGRDPPVSVPTKRSIELSPRPPQDLLPGEGGALLKEGRDPALAAFVTFADLARQGYVHLEAEEFEDQDPRVTVTERGENILATGLTELLPVEEKLLRELYELEQEVHPEPLTLKELQKKREMLKEIGNEIMDRTVAAGYYEGDPRVVRKSIAKKVGVYSLGASVGTLLLVILFRAWGGLVLLGASFASEICLLMLTFALPRKTERGAAKAQEYEIFLKEITTRAELAKAQEDPKAVAHLIEQFFPWLLIASIPTAFNLYNWLKTIEKMPKAQRYPYHCSWYTYPHVIGSVEPPAVSEQSPSVPSSLSSFVQSFSASLSSIAASLGVSSAGGGFGAGAGAGAGGGAGGGGAGAG